MYTYRMKRYILAAVLFAPAVVHAHARWVEFELKESVDVAYFRSFSGEVMYVTLAYTLLLVLMTFLWYAVVVPWQVRVCHSSFPGVKREPLKTRILHYVAWLCTDCRFSGKKAQIFLHASAIVFAKIPAFVMLLGAWSGWILMPSFPVEGIARVIFTVVQIALAVWVLSGKALRPLGSVLMAIFVYLGVVYGIAAVDVIPVFASAAFYYWSTGVVTDLNHRQLEGVRIALGAGFFLLGLVNKIYIAELVIGVADNYPSVIEGSRALIPTLTREAWALHSGLVEMVFGLAVLFGVFTRVSSVMLTFIFSSLILVFGWSEVVHIYPIAGFLLLFMWGPNVVTLDHLFDPIYRFFTKHGGKSVKPRMVQTLSAASVALTVGLMAMIVPMLIVTEVLPRFV